MEITIKTTEDIVLLREGGKILADILDVLEQEVVVGATSLGVDDKAMELMEKYDVEPMILGYQAGFAPRPYPAATCVSVNDVVVHGIPNEEPVTFQDGDVVSIDVVIAYEGMVVDSARTVIAGEASDEVRQLLHVTQRALDAGIKAAQPGNYIGDIGEAIEKVVPEQYGLIESFCGHGVGYDLHEEPQIPNFKTADKGPKILPGMVLAIEPMITLGSKEVMVLRDGYTAVTEDGSISAHMEHTVLITENGPEKLTRSRRQ
ncbi:MAG: methionyl aminopeptidase [Acidimicrobiales bacterium]|jgi:methionyl aminopeptidase